MTRSGDIANVRSRTTRRGAYLARLTGLSIAALILGLSTAPSLAGCRDNAAAGVDWSECDKMRLMLGQVDLSGGEFVQTFFSSSDLRGANFANANLSLAEVSNASLSGADLSGASLEKAVGTRADFSQANLTGANLMGAELSRGNFQRANLSGADFTNSEVNRSDFTEADLTGAKMAKAELARIVLVDAAISGVTFSYSNLSRADLTGTDLEDADFTGTYMFLTRVDGADLSHTKGLTGEQLAIACGSSKTLLPDGVAMPEHWPCPDYSAE
jgi:uncharacterized protein YjbI with pentapeptide repeats